MGLCEPFGGVLLLLGPAQARVAAHAEPQVPVAAHANEAQVPVEAHADEAQAPVEAHDEAQVPEEVVFAEAHEVALPLPFYWHTRPTLLIPRERRRNLPPRRRAAASSWRVRFILPSNK